MKINYNDYEEFSTKYVNEFNGIKEEINKYKEMLVALTNNGVISGAVHDELLIFIDYVNKIPEYIDDAISKVQKLVSRYLSDMNEAQCLKDKYIIYSKDYNKTRDFTDEYFENLKYLCDSTKKDTNIFEEINDFAQDIVTKAIHFIGKSFDWFDARDTQLLVLEANDITLKKLIVIQEDLKETERKYVASAKLIEECLFETNNYINVLNEIMSTDVSCFSVTPFIARLTDIYNKMMSILEKIDFDDVVNEEDIINYIKGFNAENFFLNTDEEIRKYIGDLSTLEQSNADFWKILITQSFDIAQHEVYHGFSTAYSYDDYIRDAELLDIIEDMTESESYDESELNDKVGTLERLLGYVKKYGDNWEKELTGKRDSNNDLLLDKRTTEYKLFKEFFDQFGNAEKILKYGTDFCEILAKLCADYEKNLKILDSIEAYCGANEIMQESLTRVKAQYEKALSSIWLDLSGKISEYGIDFITDNFDKLYGVGIFSTVGYIKAGINIVGKVTGISDEAQAKHELISYGSEQLMNARKAYNNSLKALKNCHQDSEGYDKCLKDFENCFDYYRITQKRLYEKMAQASKGVQEEYYDYCAKKLEQLSLSNYESFELMTFEEYKAM